MVILLQPFKCQSVQLKARPVKTCSLPLLWQWTVETFSLLTSPSLQSSHSGTEVSIQPPNSLFKLWDYGTSLQADRTWGLSLCYGGTSGEIMLPTFLPEFRLCFWNQIYGCRTWASQPVIFPNLWWSCCRLMTKIRLEDSKVLALIRYHLLSAVLINSKSPN